MNTEKKGGNLEEKGGEQMRKGKRLITLPFHNIIIPQIAQNKLDQKKYQHKIKAGYFIKRERK